MTRPTLLALCLLFAPSSAQAIDDVTVKEVKNLPPERCLALPPAELATRCPLMAGRHLVIGNDHVALLDRIDQKKGTYWCDQDGGPAWRCRRIVVIDRDFRGARKRNPQAFALATDLLRLIATAPMVKLGDEFGALFAPGERPRTCIDLPQHGCAVQAVRLRGRAADVHGTPMVRRRLWLVEDADGTTLQCSDAALTRCDELTAAGWLAITVTLRPSSLATAEPAPELDVPEVRADHQKGGPIAVGGIEAAETPAGTLDPWVKPTIEKTLPRIPTKADLQKAGKVLELKGKACLTKEQPMATVDMIFTGEGNLVSVGVEGATPDQPVVGCMTALAKKLELPRFSSPTFRWKTIVLMGPPPKRR